MVNIVENFLLLKTDNEFNIPVGKVSLVSPSINLGCKV